MSRSGYGSGSSRRKSFAFFSRPTILPESETTQWRTKDDSTPMKPRPKSLFGGSGGSTEASTVVTSRRILTKVSGQRPKSVFSSLKSREPNSPIASSASSSLEDSSNSENHTIFLPVSAVIMHAGEVVTGSGLLRKKKEYMVLTNQELLKYKSEAKAHEAFGLGGRHPGARASSIASIGEGSEHTLITLMNQVISVSYAGPEYESGSSVQVDYLDVSSGSPSSTTLTAPSRTEAQVWVDRLRSVSAQARISSMPPAYPDSTVEHIARRLEAEKDYSPMHFQIFRVVQRSGKSGTRSNEDLQKMYSTMCYFAIGIHKVHLVPMRPATNKTSLAPTATSSFGILNLSALSISSADDSFSLTFRAPCRYPQKLSLASADAPDILQAVRQAVEYLRPLWQIPPFSIDLPESMKDEPWPDLPPTPGDDLNGFDRTLAAFCTAYGLDASQIMYTVNTTVEDAPQFQLLAPPRFGRRHYTDLELLAILRTLRWNDAFCSISFAGIHLAPLANVYDTHGSEYEPLYERSGRKINLKASVGPKPLLVHELRALALYCGKLRRIDFWDTMNHLGTTTPIEAVSDKACPIVEAIMPLCRRGLTNVDWLIFNGIRLGEADLDWLVDAAASRLAHFRGIELSRCGLTERMLTLFLNALSIHENTLESLDICGNPCRMSATTLNNALTYFPFLRKLNISRLLRSSGDDAVLTAETLHKWRLEELDLSETQLNPETVEAIATYLASPQSDALYNLALTHCGLTARDVALLMHSMERTPGKARNMHLHIGENALAYDAGDFTDCIANGKTPSHLTMKIIDYPREEPFQELIRALTVNKTITYLDMSKISLPYQAGDKTSTLLGELFAKNSTLKDLDISGDQAVLESASLGAGLRKALASLVENNTLEILKIELQSLGTPGAMALASVISNNTTLREIHCDKNEIHLQGFTAIIDALEHNQSILYLPRMDVDRSEQMKLLKEKLCQPAIPDNWDQHPQKQDKKSSFRKSSKNKKVTFSEEDALLEAGIDQNLMLLEEKWESETLRLQNLITRNQQMLTQERNRQRRLGANSASSAVGGMGLLWGIDAS